MENYLKKSVIGEGAYGVVYKVECRDTKKIFALKYYKAGVEDATVRELSCLTALKGHPYVVHMHDCFTDEGQIAMLLSYVPYTLDKVIHNGRGVKSCDEPGRVEQSMPLSFVAHFSHQVANALSYMHALNIVHRDLTPFNVLLTDDLTVKVADMGLSRLSKKWMSPTVVTEIYRAPELFAVSGAHLLEYTCAIDTWSLGVMIADAMEGKIVFLDQQGHMYQIVVDTLGPKANSCKSSIAAFWGPDTIMPNVTKCELVKRILSRLLAFCHTQRLLAHELLNDTEWTRVSQMTEEDKIVVRDLIRKSDVKK